MKDFEVFISQDKIADRIQSLAKEIKKDFENNSEPILFAPILKGSFIFAADLIRALDLPVEVDFLEISSYDGTKSSGEISFRKDFRTSIGGKNVLIVEDIVDTGTTLKFLLEELKARKPAILKTACLLSKPSRREVEISADYTGFEIEDHFVVGYGLDYNQKFRGFPDIRIYSEQ